MNEPADEPIRIAPYDPEWPARFDRERDLLRGVIGIPRDLPRYRDELAFRDHLRSNPGKARDYADLKHRLATRFEYDREGYTDAKADFIEHALREAEGNADSGARK